MSVGKPGCGSVRSENAFSGPLRRTRTVVAVVSIVHPASVNLRSTADSIVGSVSVTSMSPPVIAAAHR